MPIYWDFRKILGIYPESDYRCVAVIAKEQETRCTVTGNWMNREYHTKAANLLDAMDRTESLSECLDHLDDLAFFTMCENKHKNLKSFRDDRCRRWNCKISTFIASSVQDEKGKDHVTELDTGSAEITSTESRNKEFNKVE